MKHIIRNLFAGLLVLAVWAMIISGTVSMARAEELPDKKSITEIKLLCGFDETMDYAIAVYMLPVQQRASIRPLIRKPNGEWTDWIPVHVQPSPTEYSFWVDIQNGYMVFTVNRQTLEYSVVQSIDMNGKKMIQGGRCTIVQ